MTTIGGATAAMTGVASGTGRALEPGAQREARIINLSSIFGVVAPPGQTAYASAKFALRGFSCTVMLGPKNGPVRGHSH